MKNIRRVVSIGIVCCCSLLFSVASTYAQGGSEGEYSKRVGRVDASLLFGGLLALGSGTFTTSCDCLFDAGLSGFGGYGGAGISYAVTGDIDVLGRVAYQTLAATYTKENTALRYTSDGSTATVVFRREAEMAYGTLAFAVLGRWRSGFETLWLAGGPEVAILFPGAYKETEEIISGRGVYASTGTRNILLADQPLDEQFKDMRTVGVSLCIGAGYDLILDKRLTITPELMWSYPVTTFLPSTNALRHFPLRAGVALTVQL
ncbi:MAG: hypothetical protein HY962_13850 [Ignavibacteriae bacterium]|nr:hypothetical protein [Ignavibacteriota bacterium]